MGKFKRARINPDKKEKKKNNGGFGPCGLKWLSKKCKKTKRNTKPTSKCKTGCRFNNKSKKMIVA